MSTTATKRRILVVEDEPDIAEVIRITLSAEGYDVEWVANGEDAITALENERINLILLDIILPGMDGHEVCRRLRSNSKTEQLPVIMLTSMTDETDMIVGLGMGADDYVRKPFSGPELVARVRAALRRASGSDALEPQDRPIVVDGLEIDPRRHTVRVEGKSVALTLAEFRLLHFLIANEGRAFSRQELLPHVVGEGVYVIDRNIDVHVRNVRRKLEDHASHIVTVRGVGYRFDSMSD